MAASRFVFFSTTTRVDGCVLVLLLLPDDTSPADDVVVLLLLLVVRRAVLPDVPLRVGAGAAAAVVPVRSSDDTVSIRVAGVA